MRPVYERPADVLRTADAVMRASQPCFTATFHHFGQAYRARWVYPGRLFVYDRHTGALVAKSRLGRPAVLATR